MISFQHCVMSRGQICAWQFLFPNQVGYLSSLHKYIYICLLQGFPRILCDIFQSQILKKPLRLSMHSWLVSASKVFLRLRKIKRSALCVVRKHPLSKCFLRLCSYLSGEDVSSLVDVCLKSCQSHLYNQSLNI